MAFWFIIPSNGNGNMQIFPIPPAHSGDFIRMMMKVDGISPAAGEVIHCLPFEVVLLLLPLCSCSLHLVNLFVWLLWNCAKLVWMWVAKFKYPTVNLWICGILINPRGSDGRARRESFTVHRTQRSCCVFLLWPNEKKTSRRRLLGVLHIPRYEIEFINCIRRIRPSSPDYANRFSPWALLRRFPFSPINSFPRTTKTMASRCGSGISILDYFEWNDGEFNRESLSLVIPVGILLKYFTVCPAERW